MDTRGYELESAKGSKARGQAVQRVAIRELRLDDYDQVLDLWRKAGLEPNLEGKEGLGALERQIQVMGAFMLVAEDGDRLVGVALGSHDGYEGFIDRVAVDPGYRRMGLARKLVGEAERRLRDKGIRKTVVVVEAGNKASISAFKKMGFEIRDRVVYMVKRQVDRRRRNYAKSRKK